MEVNFGDETSVSSLDMKMGFLDNLNLGSQFLKYVGNILTNSNEAQTGKPNDLVTLAPPPKLFTLAEVKEHSDQRSCWIVISDKVYDVTDFLSDHPGGVEIILENAGTDATVPFDSKGHSKTAIQMMEKYCIGELVESDRRYKT